MKKCFAVMLAIVLAGICSCAFASVTFNGTFPEGQVGEEYENSASEYSDVTLYSGSNNSIYEVELVDGALPDGLTLDVLNYSTSYVILRGKPTKAGKFTFTIEATDFMADMGTGRATFTVTILEKGGGSGGGSDEINGYGTSYYNEGHSGSSEADAYIIDSVTDMVEFRDRVNNGQEGEGLYYRLANDLDLEQYEEWSPIGRKYGTFTGHFDGNGKTIKVNLRPQTAINYGLGLNSGLVSYGTALFGVVDTKNSYAIKNLNVSGYVKDRHSVAGIAVRLYNGSIENCTFTGTVSSYGHEAAHNLVVYIYEDPIFDAFAGGIVERMFSGTVKNCTVKGAEIRTEPDMAGTGFSGGIVAKISGGTVENCTVDQQTTVSVVSQNPGTAGIRAGGIVSIAEQGSITNNTSEAQINADGKGTMYIGGIVAEMLASGVSLNGNRYSGANYGVGYDTSGIPSDRGCSKISSTNETTTNDNTNTDNTGNTGNNTGNTNTDNNTGNTGNTDTGNTDNNANSVGSGGGGGCNTGITLLGLLAAMFIIKKSA